MTSLIPADLRRRITASRKRYERRLTAARVDAALQHRAQAARATHPVVEQRAPATVDDGLEHFERPGRILSVR